MQWRFVVKQHRPWCLSTHCSTPILWTVVSVDLWPATPRGLRGQQQDWRDWRAMTELR